MKTHDFFNLVNDAIAPDFRKAANAGYIVHEEIEDNGSISSSFTLKASAPFVAFSMDVRGKKPVAILKSGKICSVNDLTFICLDSKGYPLVFIFEHKDSFDIRNAQLQIECGQAFCEYLFRLLELQYPRIPKSPRFFGIAVYRLKYPPKGTTRPNFVPIGVRGLNRAYWDMNIVLPLTELIRATEKT